MLTDCQQVRCVDPEPLLPMASFFMPSARSNPATFSDVGFERRVVSKEKFPEQCDRAEGLAKSLLVCDVLQWQSVV
jgi:hypothetical protein